MEQTVREEGFFCCMRIRFGGIFWYGGLEHFASCIRTGDTHFISIDKLEKLP